MSEIARMIDERRGTTSYDDLAREIGIKTPTLFRYIKGDRNMTVPGMRLIAAWAAKRGDFELLEAMAEYALGVEMVVE